MLLIKVIAINYIVFYFRHYYTNSDFQSQGMYIMVRVFNDLKLRIQEFTALNQLKNTRRNILFENLSRNVGSGSNNVFRFEFLIKLM